MSAHAHVLDLIEAVSREPAWLADHRAEVLAAVRACDQDGLRETGTRLAAAVWPAARLVPDPGWWAELAEAGEALAIADRDPAALVDLLHGSAATFAEQGDRPRAEERWVRALAVVRHDGFRDADRGQAVLRALGALYRDWGRLSKALDAYLGLVDLRRDDPGGLADAFIEVGTTMYAAGRLQSATDYFDRADETLSETTAEPETHARVLLWCGRTRWELGEHGPARRRWSRALALLVDVDDEAANQVRALLAAEPGDLLEFPYSSKTASSPSGGVG